MIKKRACQDFFLKKAGNRIVLQDADEGIGHRSTKSNQLQRAMTRSELGWMFPTGFVPKVCRSDKTLCSWYERRLRSVGDVLSIRPWIYKKTRWKKCTIQEGAEEMIDGRWAYCSLFRFLLKSSFNFECRNHTLSHRTRLFKDFSVYQEFPANPSHVFLKTHTNNKIMTDVCCSTISEFYFSNSVCYEDHNEYAL